MDEKYLQDLYEWIKSNDSSYEGRYSYDQFKQKIQDENYASQMHKWISGIDNTFEERRPLDAFIKLVKQPTQQPMAQEQQPIKKKEDWESSWFGGDGTSESEPSGTSTFDKAQKFLSSQQPKEQVKPKQELDLEYVMGTDIAKKQFEQKMTPKREENLTRPLEQIKIEETAKQVEGERIEKTPKFLRPLVEEIDKDFMTRPTQTVVPELNYLYGDAGFKFSGPSRQGLINATSPDGETLSVNIGMIGYNTDAEIAKLKNFIRDKSSKISNIKSIEDKYLGENMKFLNKKQIDDEMKSLNESAESIKNEFKGYLAEKTKLEELQKKINEYPQNLKATPEYNALIEEYNATVENNNSKSEFINQARESIIASENNLKKAAGDYTKMKEGQGNFLGAMWDETMSGLGSMAAWWSDFTTNRYWDNVPLTYALGAENYKDLFELKKEELNKGLPEGVTVLDDKINQAIRDDMKKLQKYGKIEAPDGFKFEIENITQKELRDFFKENLGATTTSDEYTRKIQQEGNIVQRGLLGLAKSAPAMVGPSFVRILNMYSQTTDAISEEMENDPDFKYVSEAEKERIGVPIGIVGAALEEFGFRNALKGTSIVKNLTGRVINRLPAGATASQIRTAAIQEIKNMGVKGTLALTGSALAEAETGASQQIAEYALKDIYNIMKGKEMFDTPDFFSEKYLMDVADAAATETVGALVLGTPNAIASAFQKDGFQGLDDATFKIFEEISKDADSRKFFVVNLKNKINAGEITSDQGKNILSAYDQASGMISQVTDEITDVNDRKIAMDLMAERKRLENKKEGKDPALSKPIQDKIDKINEQLTQLTQDAIQKQATSEVSLQPEAEPSKEMEAGGPEAGPEAAPKQGVLSPEESKRKEELTTALQNIEAGATAVTIGEATMDIADAQAELDAILQKEQAIPEAQKQTITDIFTAAPTETKQSIIFKSPNGIIVSMVGNEQMAAQLYEEAIATPEEQRSQQQNNIVEKMQPLVTAAAPAIEVTPEAAPVQPVETFTEQDKARQQELTDALAKADKRRKNITVGETVMPKADVKAELDALNQKELSSQQPTVEAAPVTETAPALSNVESTAKALEGKDNTDNTESIKITEIFGLTNEAKSKGPWKRDKVHQFISEEYHQAKADGSNPQLVEAVEKLLGKEAAPTETAPVQKLTPEQEAAELEKLFNAPRSEKPTSPKEKNVIRNTILNAAKAIAKVLPKVNIVVHETIDDYINATGDTEASSGLYVPSADGGTIHINLENSNRRTAGHEVFHAILLRGIKTDAEAQRLAKAMLNAVMKSLNQSGNNQELLGKIQEFVSNYDENIQNEESLAEIFGYLADGYPSLDAPTKNIIQRFLDRIAKLFGLKAMNDKDIIDFMNTIAKKVATGEEITESDIEAINQGASTFIFNPTTIRILPRKQRSSVEINKNFNLSFVDKKDIIDIESLINDIANKKQKVWFWVADQLGRGFYYDTIINKEHYLDAGPSFALDPKNRSRGVIWASGAEVNLLEKNVNQSDYIFIISGSPESSKLFNKTVFDLFAKRIGDFESFKKDVLENKPTKAMREVLMAHDSWDTLREDSSTDNIKTKKIGTGRKKFLIAINESLSKPNSSTYKILENKNALLDINELRDGFYKENGFGLNDIMLVLKPTSVGGKSSHSTYENDILGEVIGVPNRIVNSFDIMPEEIKNKYKNITETQKSQVIAPYGVGIREVSGLTPRQQKVKYAEPVFIDGEGWAVKTLPNKYDPLGGISVKTYPTKELAKVEADKQSERIAQKISDKDEAKKEADKLDQQFPSARKQVTAYHGSPHKFDKFTTDKMGTGEGVQAFGWGLYFTDLKSIAQQYAINLSKPNYDKIQKRLLNSGEKENVINDIIDFSEYYDYDYNKVVDALRKYDNEDAIKYLEKNKDLYEASKGNVYEVTLHQGKSPEKYTWLEWYSKPNKEQIQKLFSKLTREQIDEAFYYGLPPDATNETIYKGLSKIFKSPQKASLFLLENGIDGIKFPAESISRGATSETARGFNYVVFDENAVEITARHQKAKKELKDIIKTAIANEYSDEGIRIFLKNIGLNDADIDTLLGTVAEARESKLNETKLPGYNEMMSKVDAMIARQIKRGTAIDKMAKNLDALLRKFDAYINATDAQKKALEQEARNRIGAAQKRAPSTGRILGAFKDITNLGRKEKSTILNNIMSLVKDAANDLANEIKAMKVNGKITISQFTAIQKRLSKVNFSNEVSISSFVDYMANVFNDVEYDNKMQEVRKLQAQAKRKTHTSMSQWVKNFTSINPELIPVDKLLDYIKALDDLNTKSPFYGTMNKMYDEVMSYKNPDKAFDVIKTFQDLIDKLESIAINKVKSVEEYVSLIRDINAFKKKAYQLLQNGVITQEQYDEAIENVGKDQAAVEKKYEKELEALKNELVSGINKQRPSENPEFSNEENTLIRKYLELSDADLKSLSPEDLFVLSDLLENISNGEIDYYRMSDIVSKAYTNSGSKQLSTQIGNANFNMSSEQGKKKLSEYESAFWEGLLGLGRATSGALQKFVVSPFVKAIGSYENFLRTAYNEFLKMKEKYNMKEYNMHRLGVLTTYLQEYMAQFDPKNKNIKDIGKRDWFKEILASTDMRDDYSSGKPSLLKSLGRKKPQIEIIKKIWESLPKDANGNVDPEAVYNSFMNNDGKYFAKNEKLFFDAVMNWKQKNLTSKQKAANELRGNPFKEIPFHMMRVRLDRGIQQIAPRVSGANGLVSIQAGTGKERANEKIGAIETNFEQLFTAGLEQTGRDFYLGNALKDINNTLGAARKNLTDKDMPLLKTISQTLSEALEFEFEKSSSNWVSNTLLAAKAAEAIFDPERSLRETIAALFSYPIRAKNLKGYKELFGKVGQMKELLEFTESPLRLRDNINKAIDINDGKIEPKGKLEKLTEYLSGLAERTMMVTSWMPNFRDEFKNITGTAFDMEKFKSSKAYREKYGKAIKEAASVADAQTEKVVGSTTKAGQRREIRLLPKAIANLVGLEGTVNKSTTGGKIVSFFNNYPYREITEFLNGFKEAAEVYKTQGISGASRQLLKPLGISMNLAIYGFLATASYGLMLMLLGGEDDEEEGEKILDNLFTLKGFSQDLAGDAVSLAASRYAVGGKAMLQLAATIGVMSTSDKEQKAIITKALKNSIYLEPLPTEKAIGFGGKKEIMNSIGLYIPQLVLAVDRYYDIVNGTGEISELYKKFKQSGVSGLTKDEKAKALTLSVIVTSAQTMLNVFGSSIPMYGKVKIYIRGIKKDAGVDNLKAPTERQKAYSNYKSEAEFMEKDPEGYLKAIEKGGKLYEYKKNQKEKEAEKNANEPLTDSQIEKLKKENPTKWREEYGPGTDYYEEQRTPEGIEKRAEQRRVKAEAARIKKQNELEEKREAARKRREELGY